VLGPQVDAAEWTAACEAADLAAPEALVDELTRSRLASQTDGGWAFVHGMLRESVERTAREQGLDVALDAWRGIAVPRGTPGEVISKLESSIRKTVESAQFAGAAAKLGVRPAFLAAAEFGELIAREDATLADLMQAIGLKK